MKKLDVIKTFLYKTIPDMVSPECNMDFISFLFNKEDIEKLEKIIIDDDKEDKIMGFNSINLLYESNNNFKDDSIRINDYDEFFNIMTLIFNECIKKNKSGNEFIRSVWLRMGVEDLNNVEKFLRRQLEFLKSDKILYYEYFKDDEKIMMCIGSQNPEFFETNNYARFILNDRRYDNYKFPVIHYEISKQNNNPICYIYGIQNSHVKNNSNKEIDEFLRPIKKDLRNKYVSKDFVLALGMFLDMIYEKGIDEIRVPILQVFNYTYHENLSNILDLVYSSYDNKEKEELEEEYNKGVEDDKVLDYMHNKTMYDRFNGKEDIISYNKTERFINTFVVMNEVFDNIEICNEPFIEGDELIIKIKKSTDIKDRLNKKNKEYSK